MFNLFKDAANNRVTVTHSIESDMGRFMDEKIPRQIIERLTEKWIDKYGADVLEALKPEEVAKSVERAVKETMARKIFNDK